MKKFFFDCGTRDSVASIGITFLRISTGLMIMLGHGISKIQKFSEAKVDFPVPSFFPLKYLSPPISLLVTIGAEVGCAALLVFGLATRPAAFILAFIMIVAAFNIHGMHPWFSSSGPSKEMAIMYLIPTLAIVLTGGGKYSFDASILKEGRRRSRW